MQDHNTAAHRRSSTIVFVASLTLAGIALGAPVATFHEYGASTIGNKTEYESGDGMCHVIAHAEPLMALAYCNGSADGGNSYSAHRSASNGGVFELQAQNCPNCTFTWTAIGKQVWQGEAKAAAGWFSDAELTCTSTLAFQGDLTIRNSCMVSVADETKEEMEYGVEVPLKFSVTYTRTRNTQVVDDEDSGSQPDSNSGSGPKVRVDTTTSADGKIDLSAALLGSCEAAGGTLINGVIQLSILVTGCNGPACPNGGPQVPPGFNPGGPTTGGGGGGGPVVLTAQESYWFSKRSRGVASETEPPLVPKPGKDG
jgi:hypothetical protein